MDHDIPLRLAEQCSRYQVGFHLMSSIGADAGSSNFYLKTKGETEEDLKRADLPNLYIYRPSVLLGPRRESRPGEKIGKFLTLLLYPFLLGPLKKYRAIHVVKVAKAMIHNASDPQPGVHVFESHEIKTAAEK